MKKKRTKDKFLLAAGGTLVILTLAILFIYQVWIRISEGEPYNITEDMRRKPTIEGYETPEEVVEYVLYQIHQSDLDLALRGCAIEEVAEYFSLQGYGEILEEFPYIQTLAPADYDNKAYIEINQARITAVYSDMLEQCMGIFGDGYELEILRIQADIPEDADGFYYQDIRDIGTVSGARDACNVVVDMRVDGVNRQMILTAARYRRHWKVLQFSAYHNYQYVEPQISEYARETEKTKLPVEWEEMSEQILPCNYHIANSRSEKDIETLARKLFIYLQRGEIWKALTYFDIYDSKKEFYPDSIFFDKQSGAVKELQEFYYRMLLYDNKKMSWIKQNVKSEAVNLTALLDASAMVYSELSAIEVTETGEGQARCKLTYRYEKRWFNTTIFLIYKDGWKVTRITKTGWKDVEDNWYYLDDNGIEQTGWQKVDKFWYYLDERGVMQTDWQKIEGKWYYLGPDGAMRKYWVQLEGKWYYLGPDGAMRRYWVKYKNDWYYMNLDGTMHIGWVKHEGQWYYLGEDGIMQIGWQKIDDSWYYLDKETGVMAADTRIDGYYIDAQGICASRY